MRRPAGGSPSKGRKVMVMVAVVRMMRKQKAMQELLEYWAFGTYRLKTWEGRREDGRQLLEVFPYTSRTKMVK